MKTLFKAIFVIFASALVIASNAQADTKNKNPILGTWILVSCEPKKDNPCASGFVAQITPATPVD
ncbi:hypothetical protein [Paracidovorax anthurii]|uniref:hypothetical protein n=1 Tax=Paracidovorax anthurii TaxID=78229 RepID=UPI0011BE4797|nr:hypothetical protein [Paracidovorax anthurii]